ncbi:hypothetical protein SPI_03580 [Niveomyces insectorum RCEF 264]|uniref:Uncharacterized protein n=1 Tax=Niveomyces insectorum RCEF 264 TaxID=1081102 RepID=A0A167W745_9HYPO|nr:hypothetical protein SPI_03580 [Niveomyces insectorum RCEF 264]
MPTSMLDVDDGLAAVSKPSSSVVHDDEPQPHVTAPAPTVHQDKNAANASSLLEDNGASRPENGEQTVGQKIVEALPVPSSTQPVTDPQKTEIANHIADAPTLSHSLAVGDHDEKGAAQQAHLTEEVTDLGWNEKKQDIVAPLVGGMDNEELWLLIRRFNKQMYHVKEVAKPVPGDLDLNIADEEEFSPDKLRANIERLYMTVGIGLMNVYKHIARLRSWRERRRTAVFASVYFLAWALDLTVPLMSATIIALTMSPKARSIMFPPAPIALVGSHGGVQKPRAGVLGSHDSATGAPENHKGEAVEAEASNFVNGIATVALTSATGKHPQGDPDSAGDDAGDAAPDPTAIAAVASDAKGASAGKKPDAKHDKTKVPMETAMWTKMRPIMHGLADVSDTWERLGNALSPTPPFPRELYRLRLAALVVPLLLLSLFVTSYMFMKGLTFGIGFGFFGDPIISRGLTWLNHKFPHWQKLLELRNTILKGVPTNAQLTLTLLRIGEANKAPLPPPPRVDQAPPEKPAQLTDEHLRSAGGEPPLNATSAELDEAIEHDPRTAHDTGSSDIDAAKDTKHGKKGSKILSFFKGTTRGTVKTAIGTDSVKAKLGSQPAKDRLGAVPNLGEDLTSGPVEFKARYGGEKGHVYITAKATIPAVAFAPGTVLEKVGVDNHEDVKPIWSIPIGDIKELKKIGGFGWKAKIVVGWSLEREIADGLEITDRTGNTHKVTALPLRDELFNRLVAMGGQKWEAW